MRNTLRSKMQWLARSLFIFCPATHHEKPQPIDKKQDSVFGTVLGLSA
ncbi:hypothetical protein NJC40_16120 [Pseudomonas sp. 21LCFQ02]|nr:hypothetical protein [Pseudomonas sp. 21LCFQ02]MCO8169299.1 hypothetical protein [Pseudomonas sp. 21LCFQ02]